MSDDRVTPVPDNPAGANLPYRGAVDHGVPYAEVEPTDEAHYHSGRPVEFLPEDTTDDVAPIAVRVVGSGTREIKQFRVFRSNVAPGNFTGLVGRDSTRSSIKIRNIGAETVYIGDSMGVTNLSGYPLATDAELSLNTTDAVYAAVASAAAVNGEVAVLVEFAQVIK
jgi:hypothetical protein